MNEHQAALLAYVTSQITTPAEQWLDVHCPGWRSLPPPAVNRVEIPASSNPEA